MSEKTHISEKTHTGQTTVTEHEPQRPLSIRSQIVLHEEDLEQVMGAGSKPGASPGIGV